jgi:Carbohydrate phosphorylase
VDEAYADQQRWTRMSIMSTAGSGYFSSDRTIQQYAEVHLRRSHPSLAACFDRSTRCMLLPSAETLPPYGMLLSITLLIPGSAGDLGRQAMLRPSQHVNELTDAIRLPHSEQCNR